MALSLVKLDDQGVLVGGQFGALAVEVGVLNLLLGSPGYGFVVPLVRAGSEL